MGTIDRTETDATPIDQLGKVAFHEVSTTTCGRERTPTPGRRSRNFSAGRSGSTSVGTMSPRFRTTATGSGAGMSSASPSASMPAASQPVPPLRTGAIYQIPLLRWSRRASRSEPDPRGTGNRGAPRRFERADGPTVLERPAAPGNRPMHSGPGRTGRSTNRDTTRSLSGATTPSPPVLAYTGVRGAEILRHPTTIATVAPVDIENRIHRAICTADTALSIE